MKESHHVYEIHKILYASHHQLNYNWTPPVIGTPYPLATAGTENVQIIESPSLVGRKLQLSSEMQARRF